MNKTNLLKIAIAATTLLAVSVASAYTPSPRARGSTILNVKNYGAKGDGKANDTAAIQKAINALPAAGGTVQIPAGTYMIDAGVNLKLRSKMHLQLASTAVLKTIPNALERSYVINVLEQSDVEISGGKILGDRALHKITTGEWGHAIMVRGSKRVTVRNITLKDNWGDGMSIGATAATETKASVYSDDVVIDNVISTNNRRQGLSIGRSYNVKVFDSEFSHTNGTAPEYGIDVEPDPAEGFHMDNVRIENCKIHSNAGGGILVYKQVSNVTISLNEIYNQPYGVYTVGSFVGTIWNNEFYRHKYHGVALRPGTADYQVFANKFRNNYTVTKGILPLDAPLTSITGNIEGTKHHLNVYDDPENVKDLEGISIRRNWYSN